MWMFNYNTNVAPELVLEIMGTKPLAIASYFCAGHCIRE